MSALELRIPPPVVALAIAAVMWAAAAFGPVIASPAYIRLAIGLTVACLGVAFSAAAAVSFRKAKTTVNPLKPETASALVTTGVYRISRNPMYVGLVVVLIGLAVFLASPLAVAGPVLLYFHLGRFQIAPEERTLAKMFGRPYIEYQHKVRRWL